MPASAPTEPRLALSGLAAAVGARRRGRAPAFCVCQFRGHAVLEVVDSADGERAALAVLRDRVASRPVVTADAEAALDLLRRADVEHLPPVWDVLELARLLAPERRFDDLDGVAAALGLEREEPGTEGDARLLVGVFDRLLEEIERAEPSTIAQVNRLAAPLDWPFRTLFVEAERLVRRRASAPGPPSVPFVPAPRSESSRRRGAATPRSTPTPLDADRLADFFATDGSLARSLPGYEARPEQVEMAQAIGRVLTDEGHLFVEAGTGIGKSLAYLLPASLTAIENRWRVVVSTATTTLQDQLFAKDLPVVRAVLGAETSLRAAVLKGRGNYLCLRRWQALLQSDSLEPHERTLLIKTLFWLPRTGVGDRAELRLTPREEEAWLRLSAESEACTPARCAFNRIGACFLARARRAAEEAHIVILNHALLLSDLANRSRILPDYQVLIVDEAHHLEDEATSQLGWHVSERELLARLERLWSPIASGRAAQGCVPEALSLLRKIGAGGPTGVADLATGLLRAESAVPRAARSLRALFARLGRLATEDGGASDGESTLRLTRGVRSGSAWQEAEELWAEAGRLLQAVLRVASDAQQRLEEVGGASDEVSDLAAEIAGQLDFWSQWRQRLDTAIHTPDASTVYWLSTTRSAWTVLCAAPLDVASTLSDGLFADPRAVALVSATLTVGGSFDYVKRRLGLPEADAVQLGSPFDYERAALLYVPYDLPDPTQPGYQETLERALEDTIARVGGRTLVLFTSRAQLQATYRSLRGRLDAAGIQVLGQGIDEASRTRLLETFRRRDRVALFGTSSFWEGIDVVGEALSCVAVARLPFAVPTDPVYAARAEQFEEPFSEYAVPQAVLRFKQGFGRLIRSRSDRGAVVVLDRRIATRGYGAVFTRSLPRCTTRQGPAARTGQVVADWLARGEAALTETRSARG